MKKTTALILTIVLLLCSVACTSCTVNTKGQSADATPMNPPENFDAKLIGEWIFVSAQENGQLKFTSQEADGSIKYIQLGFTYSGGVYGNLVDEICDSDYFYNSNEFLPAGQASTENDMLTITHSIEGLDVTMQYSFQDAKQSSNKDDTHANYYAKYDNDQLTIHIAGEYQSSATRVDTIDTTVVFEKVYPVYHYRGSFDNAMIGTWIDNLGNTWTFTVDKKANADRDYSFYMIDSNKKRYIGSSILFEPAETNDPESVETLTIYFKNDRSSANVDNAKIILFDGYTLSLELEDGPQLILQRVS